MENSEDKKPEASSVLSVKPILSSALEKILVAGILAVFTGIGGMFISFYKLQQTQTGILDTLAQRTIWERKMENTDRQLARNQAQLICNDAKREGRECEPLNPVIIND